MNGKILAAMTASSIAWLNAGSGNATAFPLEDYTTMWRGPILCNGVERTFTLERMDGDAFYQSGVFYFEDAEGSINFGGSWDSDSQTFLVQPRGKWAKPDSDGNWREDTSRAVWPDFELQYSSGLLGLGRAFTGSLGGVEGCTDVKLKLQ